MELVKSLDVASIHGRGFTCILLDSKNNCTVHTDLCRLLDSTVLPDSRVVLELALDSLNLISSSRDASADNIWIR